MINMANGNYEHVQRQNRQKFLQSKLREQKQADIAKLLNRTSPAISQKIKKNVWTYEELCTIFSNNKEKFTNDEILLIMGRSPDDSNKKMANYLLGKIDQMLTEHLDNKTVRKEKSICWK